MAETTRENALGQFRETAGRSEPGEAVRFAQGRFLDELPGIMFGTITLIWVIASFVGLTWRELPAEVIARVGVLTHLVLGSHMVTLATRVGTVAGVAHRAYSFLAGRNTA